MDDLEFLEFIEEKLMEELGEYFDSGSVEELVDLMEAIFRVAELKGFDRDTLEEIRKKKLHQAGGFEKNLVLTEVYQDPQKCGLVLCTCEKNDLVFEDD